MAMLLVGCDEYPIMACGKECKNGMKRYARDTGCECVVPEPATSAKVNQ